MVVVGLIAVLVISVVVARVGLAWLERPTASAAHDDDAPPIDEPVIDLREPTLEGWARRGFTNRDAMVWMEHGLDPDEAFLFRTLGIEPSTAARLHLAGVTDETVVAWRSAGWNLDEALQWIARGFEPTAAGAWREGGFRPAEADLWRREHFGVRQAVEWRRLGDTPAHAREVARRFVNARVTVAEGLRRLEEGHSVDDICADLPSR